MSNFQQQGDVLLVPVDKLPDEAKQIGANKCTLALGEATGHSHVLEGDCALLENETSRFVSVKKQSVLKHEEHGHQVIQPGLYEVKIVREIDPFSEETRKVQD